MNVQGMQQQSLVKNEPLGHSDTLWCLIHYTGNKDSLRQIQFPSTDIVWNTVSAV